MRLFTAVLLLLVAPTLYAQLRTDVTMNIDGVDRQFIVVVPSTPPPTSGYPLVFMFHGTSGDGERFYNVSGWKELGADEGIVTVFPSSLAYCIEEDGKQKTTTKWNNGDLQNVACPGQTLRDDVKFVRAMVDTISRTLPIDASRLFASGFSNGAVFAAKLAIEASDIFSAITFVAGPLARSDSGAPLRRIPLVQMLGTNDDNVISRYGVSPPLPFETSTLDMIEFEMRSIRGAFGLDSVHTDDQTQLTLSRRFATPLPGETASEYTFVLVRDMPHVYPNGTNFPINAASLSWQFFTQAVASADREPASKREHSITLVPNPARTEVLIDGYGGREVALRTLLGEQVHASRTSADGRLALPTLPSGSYLLQVETEEGFVTRPLVIVR